MGQVSENESIPSEERMENPEDYEGFENEDLHDRSGSKSSGRYSAEEVPEEKTRG